MIPTSSESLYDQGSHADCRATEVINKINKLRPIYRAFLSTIFHDPLTAMSLEHPSLLPTRTHACTEPLVSLSTRVYLPASAASVSQSPTRQQLHFRNLRRTSQTLPPPHKVLLSCQLSIMVERILKWPLANKSLMRVAEIEVVPAHKTQDSMPPTSGDVAQTPEPKSTSGLASVFKSLTGSKSSKSPNVQSPASTPQHLGNANTLKNAIYGGPLNYEKLFEQLKVGNPLQERLAAAESLRHAVQDYPLSGVCYPNTSLSGQG